MRNPWDVIADIEAVSGRNDKMAFIKAESDANNEVFFAGLKLACDSMIMFGVKKVPISKSSGDGLQWDEFVTLANKLSERELSGNAAITAINQACKKATLEQWNYWYRRILLKDLKCGVTETSINAVVTEKFKVPVFTVQLAHDGAKHPNKIKGKKLIEIKLDGTRVVTVVHPSGKVQQFSRNGKQLVNFTNIITQFEKIAPMLTEAMVFDGEIMSSSFQDLMKQLYRKSNVKTDDAVLWLFDMVPYTSFVNGIYNKPQIDRSQELIDWFSKVEDKLPNVRLVGHELVDISTDEGHARFRQINNEAVASGFEGIMIKDPAAPYELKRTVSWLKEKPFITVDLEVVDMEEGTGKNEGRLGALVCEGWHDGVFVRTNVGSGFSDEQRDHMWTDRGSVVGYVVEVKADAVTKNQNGEYSLRFARFERFRGFAKGEKM